MWALSEAKRLDRLGWQVVVGPRDVRAVKPAGLRRDRLVLEPLGVLALGHHLEPAVLMADDRPSGRLYFEKLQWLVTHGMAQGGRFSSTDGPQGWVLSGPHHLPIQHLRDAELLQDVWTGPQATQVWMPKRRRKLG